MAVPIEYADRVTRLDAGLAQGRRQSANSLADLAIRKALQIAINHLLVRRLDPWRMPQLLEYQRVLISGIGDLDQPSDHGGLP